MDAFPNSFVFSHLPPIHFGAGKIHMLPSLLVRYGKNVLYVTGGTPERVPNYVATLLDALNTTEDQINRVCVHGEPSPQLVDEACQGYRSKSIDVVVGIGGGSVIDAAKAISAMLPLEKSVKDFLEGVGTGEAHPGTKVPFIALPTTSGTGSEITKNAVLSEIGEQGFKKSLRHDNFIPDVVIVDPELMVSCPNDVTVHTGMDALTQVLEPYFSPQGSVMTDAMAYFGIEAIVNNIATVVEDPTNGAARSAMAYGALMGGICLANAGLGVVHGFAGPLGARYPIAHGHVCAALLAPSMEVNLNALRERAPESEFLNKMAKVGYLMGADLNASEAEAQDHFVSALKTLSVSLGVNSLGCLNMSDDDKKAILSQTKSRNNPIELLLEEIAQILELASK